MTVFKKCLHATYTIKQDYVGAGQSGVFMQSFVILAIIFIAPTITVPITRDQSGTWSQPGGINRKFDIKTLI